jgi:hypothetical protein
VIFRQCTIFSHGTAIETEVEGANIFMDHTTISILGPSGVGIGGTGKGIEAISPNFLWIDHCWINGAIQAIYVVGHPADPTETKAQITINFSRLTNNWSQILLNGLHLDPHIAIGWNEVLSRPGSTDAINIYRSSGIPGAPILIHDNYVQGVAPATPDTLNFSGSGIVTDGDTADPLLATSSVEIANNQVVGCVTTGIALAFGLTRSPTITWSCLAA